MSEPVGSLADESRRLVQALAAWAERRTPPAAATHPGEWDVPAAPGPRPASCDWCPVCQVAAFVRGERPEVLSRLADAGAGALAALTQLLEQHQPHDTPAEPSAPAPASAPDVQRIRVL